MRECQAVVLARALIHRDAAGLAGFGVGHHQRSEFWVQRSKISGIAKPGFGKLILQCGMAISAKSLLRLRHGMGAFMFDMAIGAGTRNGTAEQPGNALQKCLT